MTPDGEPTDGQPPDDQPGDQPGDQAGDQGSGDQAGDDQSGDQAGQPTDGQAGDQGSGDEPADDQQSDGQDSSDQPADDGQQPDAQDSSDQPADDEQPDGQDSGDQPADDGQPDGQDSGDQPADQDSGDQAASPPDDQQAGDQPTDGQPAGGSAAGGRADPGQPYLIVDQYPLDSGAHPPWGTLVSTVGFCGVILKAWDGPQYNDGGWFAANWPAVREAGAARYGVSWFRGAYLFLRFAASGSAQADAYLKAIDQAGGWDSGDIIPIIDVELGDTKNPANLNGKATAQQVIDCTTQCANRIRAVTGKRIMLYGRGAMRDLKITDHMGCDVVWNPSYTAQMVTSGLETWAPEDIVLWQYCGDNVSFLPNYPHTVSGFSKIDISVYTKGAQPPTLQMVRDSLLSA